MSSTAARLQSTNTPASGLNNQMASTLVADEFMIPAQEELRLSRIMRQHASRLALHVKFHQLRRKPAVDAAVFHHADPHAGIKLDELESQG